MLRWSAIFLVIAIVAAVFGFGGIALAAAGIGYGDIKAMECVDLLRAVVDRTPVSPNFRDGYRVARICDAILESSARQAWVDI